MPAAMSSTDIAAFSAAFAHAEKILKRFECIGGKTLETAIKAQALAFDFENMH